MRIQSGVDIEENGKSQSIRNRESWLKILVLTLFSLIIAFKLVTSSFNINMDDFRFTDLLSLILSLFAIALSMAFYFKATDTSTDFYNNTYIFTKEISEILGRIEAGFGERLRHLDEGYNKLGDKFEKLPIDPIKAEQKVKKEEVEINKKEIELNRIFEGLAKRAKLDDKEKIDLLNQLELKNKEIQDSKRELNFLKHRIEDVNRHRSIKNQPITIATSNYLEKLVKEMNLQSGSQDEIVTRFNNFRENIPNYIYEHLTQNEFLNSEGELTRKGIEILKDFSERKASLY